MARYVAISESEMSDFMGAIGFTELSVEQRGSFGRKPVKERVYEAPVGVGRIRVYSSVVGPATRDRGKDAIRVQYWVGDQKVYGSKRVHRTQNWRKNLLQRTEEIRESVESGPLSRIPKDSRGDLMTARRSRLPHERFWGSVNYPEIRESRRFEAASVLPKELKTDKITDRVMAWQYLIDDSEKQHQLLKLQTALKMGLITQDEIIESLDRAMSKRTPTNIESLGAESKSNVARKAEKEELILEHLNKNRQTSKYDGKFENTEGGIVELLGITRTGVSKTLRDMEAKGLIYSRNLHVPGGRRKVQCWYVVGSGTERGFGAEALVRHDGKWKGIAWNEHELKTLTQDEREAIAQEMYEAWLAGDLIGVDVDEFYEKLEAETIYVRQMGDADQERIENELRSALRTEFQEMSPEEIESLVELGLDSKLSDLNNVIDIETFEAEEWQHSVYLTKTCRCGRQVQPYDFEMKQSQYDGKGLRKNYVDAKYRCDCGGGKCRGIIRVGSHGNRRPCTRTAEYRGYCNECGICGRCNFSLKQDYEEMGRDEGHEHGYCHQCYDDTGRYGAESFTPPASAVAAAKKGLAQRKKWGRGGLSPAEAKSQGIDSGVTRARKIASGKVSKHDVRRMSAFNRHRKNNNPSKKMPDGGPTAGTIAWNLWGGSAGVNWAKKKSAAMNAESEEGFPLTIMHVDYFAEYYLVETLEENKIGVYHTDSDAPDQVLHLYLNEIETFEADAETLDYDSFTNDMEALLAKYSQLLLTYETEYQSKERGGDGIMEVFMRFKPYNAYFDDVDFDADAEEKLSKTSCCCGATESNPCACMKAATPMSCSAIEPKCACYKDLEKNAESEDYGVEPRWM